MASRPLLTALLKDVSRSFYLTLRVLPGTIRPQLSLAYLLARATDTVADTALIPLERRLETLRRMRECIRGSAARLPDFGEFARRQANAAEAELLTRFPEALRVLEGARMQDSKLIRDVLSVVVSGQELDLERFAQAGSQHVVALGSDMELDDYTYRVAGCVGEFWTRLCFGHIFGADRHLNEPLLLSQSVRFGKGLQLVNILRDLPADLRQGRCYVPLDRLNGLRLVPGDLLSASAEPRFRRLYEEYLAGALAHLAAGWEYTNALPRSHLRIRLACAWPVLIGVKTLARLRSVGILEANRPARVSRQEVYGIVIRTVFLHPWPSAWRRLFDTSGRSASQLVCE